MLVSHARPRSKQVPLVLVSFTWPTWSSLSCGLPARRRAGALQRALLYDRSPLCCAELELELYEACTALSLYSEP